MNLINRNDDDIFKAIQLTQRLRDSYVSFGLLYVLLIACVSELPCIEATPCIIVLLNAKYPICEGFFFLY